MYHCTQLQGTISHVHVSLVKYDLVPMHTTTEYNAISHRERKREREREREREKGFSSEIRSYTIAHNYRV